MPSSINVFVYLGSGEEGRKLEALIDSEARKRGLLNKRGNPNVSAFITHCVRFTVEHEKTKK